MRSKAYRRHQSWRHMWRRVKEDRNQHYEDRTCACYQPAGMARFREQPKRDMGCPCCTNQRAHEGPTLQERRAMAGDE